MGVVVEAWEEAAPILLGEAEDLRLGLLSRVEQDRFQGRLRAPRFRADGEARPPTVGVQSQRVCSGGGPDRLLHRPSSPCLALIPVPSRPPSCGQSGDRDFDAQNVSSEASSCPPWFAIWPT